MRKELSVDLSAIVPAATNLAKSFVF